MDQPPVSNAGRTRTRLPLLHRLMLSLSIILVGSEVAVRIVDWHAGRDTNFYLPQNPLEAGQYMSHPYIGVVLRPGYDSVPEASHQAHTNSLGLRGAEVSAEKPPNTYRIMCLGGSTTFGTGATADDKTYPAQLEKLLNRAAIGPAGAERRHYEVWNCGVSGYSTAETLINFELRLVEYEPDAIVIYDGPNDARIAQTRGFRPDYSHLRRAMAITDVSPFERFLLGHVRLYAWLARGTNPQEQLGALANYMFVPGYEAMTIKSSDWLNEYGVRTFIRNVKHIIEIARSHGIQPVLSTFAMRTLNPPKGQPMTGFLVRCNEEVTRLAAETRLPLIDVAGPLTEHADLFDDFIHFNDKGELQHALIVATEAHRLGLFGLPATAASPAGAAGKSR